MIKLTEVREPPQSLREKYLNSLPEPQEHYLELLVSKGKTWQFEDAGYVVQSGNRLVELFVLPDHSHRLSELFNTAMLTSEAVGVLCKSYDAQLLHAALSKPANVKPGGLLFRRILNDSHPNREDVIIRPGQIGDAADVFSINDDFFESEAEIESYAASGGLFILESNGMIAGCGIGERVIENRDDVDIGMLVATNHRRKGYGTHLVSFLKHYFLKQNMTPICGCGPSNVASRRALEKAGFVSEHRILQITY